MLSTLTENPADVEALFTAGGQQAQLQPGQALVWTPRNELLQVTPVVRDGGEDDRESYRYDGGSLRILKVSLQSAGNSVQTQRVIYLPGLELRSMQSGNTETESLEVISVGEAGRAQVRVLHWANGKPDGIDNDQVRYSYDNLTGSSGLELDGNGKVISTEEYYPYGGRRSGRRAARWRRVTKPCVTRARSGMRQGCTATGTGTTSRGRAVAERGSGGSGGRPEPVPDVPE
ncbi:Uncharacterised protein [Enterobacter cancerogenus]|uniref:Uncharacterized protein n=1 Tax=Enterobacter cancerogenus TaxID=69218 RepID=A0A484WWV2_9ENTR|nr:Uncharacterised protein [Enterobacter cancerogenus]